MSGVLDASSTVQPSSRDEADTWLRDRAWKIVWAHLNTREDADFAPSVKSMIEQTQREYSGRFLFELIQNAYDRLPADGEAGHIAIVLVEDEGAHGTLYVANTGAGFTASNVRRIGNLGLSDKQIGKGIGNKGVGFKSVLQVCTTPEIYSTLADGTPGFCFRFGTPGDIPGLVDGDPVREGQVLDELSLYNITVPVDGVPARVAGFWAQGYASVVRLPLRADAGPAVDASIAEIESSDVPVMLFLDRLRQVDMHRVSSRAENVFELTRHSGAAPDLGDAFRGRIVDLGGEGRFLVLSREVDPGTVREVIAEAIAAGKLDQRWAASQEPMAVSIALAHEGTDAQAGRFYTYLPMGAKAPAPFAGHLNAPFFTNFARTDIPPDHPLNRLLLQEIARLCLDAARALTESGMRAAPGYVLDTLTWSEEHLPILIGEAELTGLPLADQPVVPTRDGQGWATLLEVWTWPSARTTVLDAERAHASCGVRFLPVLPRGRRARLEALLHSLDVNLDPEPERLAGWVELMVAAMAAERMPISQWSAVYTDLALLFAGRADALRGRAVLLTDDWQLRPCAAATRPGERANPADATPFFPPARQRVEDEDEVDPDADLDLPRSLSRRMFYVHRELVWYLNRQQTPARRFLQNSGLVRRFDTRSILDHIRGVLGRTRSPEVARDALHLAFNLTRSAASVKRTDLREFGLRVPTADGTWIVASTSYFSAGWPGTFGDDLSLIASTPQERSAELHALRGQLLVPPGELANDAGDVELWTRFLREIGVRDLIRLSSATDNRELWGQYVRRAYLSQVSGLPEPVRTVWQQQLPDTSTAWFPETPYTALSPLYWLPGQGDWERLTDRVRAALARQIFAGLAGRWNDQALLTVWEKNRRYDKQQISIVTPLNAFLATAPWLPVQRPAQPGVEFVRADRCWTFPLRSDRGEDGPPRFAPLLIRKMREQLDDNAMGVSRLRKVGVGVWGSSQDAPRLVRHLGKLLADGTVADVHSSQFQSMYRTAWAECIRHGTTPVPAGARLYLVADVGGQVTPLLVGGDEAPAELVVASTDTDRSLLRLLADFRRPILTVDADADKAAGLLRPSLGSQVVTAATVTPSILVDGSTFEAGDTARSRPLVDLVPHLPVLIGTLLESRRSAFDRSGQRAFDESLESLRHVRVVQTGSVQVRIGDDVRPLPDRLSGVLPVSHPTAPTLVLEEVGGELTWQTIEALAEPLLYLIRRVQLADALRLAAARLRAANAPLGELSEDDVAGACGVTATEVRTTARRVETALTPLLTRLYPLLVHFAGAEAAAAFDPEATAISGEGDAREALARMADRLPLLPGKLFDTALEVSSVDELRRAVGVGLRTMNETLASLTGRYPQIDHSGSHADDFTDHVRARRVRILDRIRWARWARFAAFEPQGDWTTIRRIDVLRPDPVWGTTVDELSVAQMDERIESELARLLGAAPPEAGASLPSVAECSKANTDLLTPHIARLTELVRAWLTAHGRPVQGPWSDPATTGRVILEALDRCGAMDFAVLSMDTALAWLAVLRIWPDGMPATDDRAVLGLSAEDLDQQRSEQRRRQAELARERRTLVIDDSPFDLGDGLAQFSATLGLSLARSPHFLTTANRHTRLEAVTEKPGSRVGGGRGGSGAGSRDRRLSDQQKVAVGFAGEWFTYQWLKQLHGSDVTPECWVSSYAGELFAKPGDDGLGWDFEVRLQKVAHYYEVKTTLGDGGQIELGETQVRAAQRHARNDQWRLIVITNVLNENRRLQVLRNPFHEKSRGRYAFLGQGLRLAYQAE